MGLLDTIIDAAKRGAGLLAPTQADVDFRSNMPGLIADFTPVIGDAKSAYDGIQAARQGDYLGAGLGALGALPFVPAMGGIVKGGDTIYHAGKKKVASIDPAMLQLRDSGFFGNGFYAAEQPSMTKGYGNVVSKFRVNDDAKILEASITPDEKPELANEVYSWAKSAFIDAAKKRGKEKEFLEEMEMIKTDPASFRHYVDKYGVAHNFDVIQYSPGEIVIKNHLVAKSVK